MNRPGLTIYLYPNFTYLPNCLFTTTIHYNNSNIQILFLKTDNMTITMSRITRPAGRVANRGTHQSSIIGIYSNSKVTVTEVFDADEDSPLLDFCNDLPLSSFFAPKIKDIESATVVFNPPEIRESVIEESFIADVYSDAIIEVAEVFDDEVSDCSDYFGSKTANIERETGVVNSPELLDSVTERSFISVANSNTTIKAVKVVKVVKVSNEQSLEPWNGSSSSRHEPATVKSFVADVYSQAVITVVEVSDDGFEDGFRAGSMDSGYCSPFSW